ncbi:LOW QUALITY PROTEIN: Per1-like [Dillenia turbinata]|uniref:Post-GPI attachment to proteins factor 3 n=1 Tax=Dillenia turbinata TaxID=194707 RepID=A0AAN8WIP5_9MAGN
MDLLVCGMCMCFCQLTLGSGVQYFMADVDLTEKLDYSSVVALLGYSLILAMIRTFNLRTEAARVMAAAPFACFYDHTYIFSQHLSVCLRYSLGGVLNMRVSTDVYGVLPSFILLWWYEENRSPGGCLMVQQGPFLPLEQYFGVCFMLIKTGKERVNQYYVNN